MVVEEVAVKIKLLQSPTHQAYMLSEQELKEIIYLLETCNPTTCANAAYQLKVALESYGIEVS